MKNNDEKYMKRCIELSLRALKAGDNPFGCVIVKNGKILSEAKNEFPKFWFQKIKLSPEKKIVI